MSKPILMPGWPPGNYLELPDNFPPERSNLNNDPPSTKQLSEWGLLAKGKTLGKSANVSFSSAGGLARFSPINVLELRGEDENALPLSLLMAPPRIAALGIPTGDIQQLSTSYPMDNLPGIVSAANPVALLEWGVGGLSLQAVVDIHNGLAVNLSTSFLRVSVGIEETDTTNTSVVYQLASMVGPGMPKYLGATRTIIVGNVDVGVESGVFNVPRFSRRVHLCGTQGPGGASFVATIYFYRSRAPANPIAEYLFALNSGTPIPIPNGAYYFTVVSGIPVINSIQAIFELGI